MAAEDGDVATGAGKGEGCGGADAAGSAGDKGDAAGESLIRGGVFHDNGEGMVAGGGAAGGEFGTDVECSQRRAAGKAAAGKTRDTDMGWEKPGWKAAIVGAALGTALLGGAERFSVCLAIAEEEGAATRGTGSSPVALKGSVEKQAATEDGGAAPRGATAAADGGGDLQRVEAAGLANVYRFTERLLCGGAPAGEEGFASLAKLGVRTIISVDGAKPDVEGAERAGIQTVHIPLQYAGISQGEAWKLAKGVRDLPGPIYLHCHHGKHRGPAAAAIARVCLDDRFSVEQAAAAMRRAGTDAKYEGLYAAARKVKRPTSRQLDHLNAEFPAVAKVGGLTEAMTAIDEAWGRLESRAKGGWQTAGKGDLGGAHEALLLEEGLREAARLEEVRKGGGQLLEWMNASAQAATKLREALDAPGGAGNVGGARGELLKAMGQSCSRCHAKFRDGSAAGSGGK